jgi:D-alanine--poly(phosphoribitol) ligase subunit 2
VRGGEDHVSSADIASIQAAIGDYITSEILLRKEPLGPDEDVFDAGFDSMSLTRVLVFVEDRFGVAIPDQDVILDELSTIGKWARFVQERLARAGR